MPDENIAETRLASPGTPLRAAREAKKWSIDEVAHKLNLSAQRVAELEADDYRLMPALPYIRGYLRSYARLLGVPESEVMQQFDALGLKEERKKPNTALNPSLEQQRAPVNMRWLLWVSLLVLVALIVIISIWFSRHGTEAVSNAPVQAIIAPKAAK